MMEWFENVDNVTRLGSGLVEAGFTAEQLQRYYEKPWKWTAEFNASLKGQEALEFVINGDAVEDEML